MRFSILCINLFLGLALFAQQSIQNIYCLSGQGSDERIFKNLSIDTSYHIIYLSYILPDKNEAMSSYALRMSRSIDTTQPFALIGVSIGGMIACEMTDHLRPEKVIIISSASSAEEIPPMYKFFYQHPVQKFLPASIFKISTFILQPLYEPDRRSERRTCNAMIMDKDAEFIKRGVDLIITWKRSENDNIDKNIIQINGDTDNTLPIKNIQANYIIRGGSHMMTLIKADEISAIINSELLK